MAPPTVPGPTMRVRAARSDDLPAIVALYNHYVANSPVTFDLAPVSVEERRDWLAEHASGRRHRLLVADDDGRGVVGWATTSPFRTRPGYATTVEASVYVRHDAVGEGVGTRLYDRLFRGLDSEDIERIVAGVVVPNPASVALHRRFGFRHVGTFTRVGRKFGRYWDVAWFERPPAVPGALSAPPETGEVSGPGEISPATPRD